MSSASDSAPRSAREIAAFLGRFRFRFTDERELQDGIERAFVRGGVAYEREVRLSARDRLDFLAGAVAVEVKVDGGLADLTRQVWRYAEDPRVRELLVVSSRSRLDGLASEINGKPVVVLVLTTAAFA